MDSPLPTRLDACLARSRARKQAEARVEPPARTSITIRNVDRPRCVPTSGGAVYIDRKRRGQVVRGRSKTFHVLPGTHRVSIWFKVGFVNSDLFTLGEGEQVALVCGSVPGRRLLKVKMKIYDILISIGYLIAGFWGYELFPRLHDSMISALTSLSGNYELIVLLFGVRLTGTLKVIGAVLAMLLWGQVSGRILRMVLGPPNRNGELFFVRLAEDHGQGEEIRPHKEPGFRR